TNYVEGTSVHDVLASKSVHDVVALNIYVLRSAFGVRRSAFGVNRTGDDKDDPERQLSDN
ncbi:hypothetical protein, partial [Geomonas anaerohicana]|uniref:hypothetical protein n=1 Tax=Geomonas anaerohicana TaxID=2798583 RepID=UPI001C06D693